MLGLSRTLLPGEMAEAEAEFFSGKLGRAINGATAALLAMQHEDGHWRFELEADSTIPAEYILLRHYLDDIDAGLEARIAVYLRETQAEHGGWPLFAGGDCDISATTKAYLALKAAGDDPDAPHMIKARRAVLALGGAERCNVFTRILLALFGLVPWRAVPVMPVEIMLLPGWFPFHLNKVSYWSRTVLVPLLVLMALKPRARNPRNIDIDELFVTPPAYIRNWHQGRDRTAWARVFRGIDRVLRRLEPYFPDSARRRAVERAVTFVRERLNGMDGLGAIYPAMANTVMMFDCLGLERDDPTMAMARAAIDKLLVVGEERAYCQPCLSPIWDTALACHALVEAGEEPLAAAAGRGAAWLAERQITDLAGDWVSARPGLKPGGWAFQYANPHYPDTDDTAVVAVALDRADAVGHCEVIARAAEWVLGLQSMNGGWGAFDADNTAFHLNHIPFADHGALLDPPTADVTARCVSMLCHLGYRRDHPAVAAGLNFLLRGQEADGSWFGRWGTNYIYGTWSVLCALNAAGIDPAASEIRRAVTWLLSRQGEDGGWGEDGRSYWPGQQQARSLGASTPSQTAWALLGLMAAGEVGHEAVARGVAHLLETGADGIWEENQYTAVGFPRVFYLRYHSYRAVFPLWALARYRNLTTGNSTSVLHGM